MSENCFEISAKKKKGQDFNAGDFNHLSRLKKYFESRKKDDANNRKTFHERAEIEAKKEHLKARIKVFKNWENKYKNMKIEGLQ